MDKRTKGIIYAILFGIFGVFGCFYCETDEEHDEFMYGWKRGFLIQLIITLVLVVIILLVYFNFSQDYIY